MILERKSAQHTCGDPDYYHSVTTILYSILVQSNRVDFSWHDCTADEEPLGARGNDVWMMRVHVLTATLATAATKGSPSSQQRRLSIGPFY